MISREYETYARFLIPKFEGNIINYWLLKTIYYIYYTYAN